MPATPETWLHQSQANTHVTGNQLNSRIVQLDNGNIIVFWVDESDSGVGTGFGSDIVGQMYDPLGTTIGGEFLATGKSDGNVFDFSVAALKNGEFVLAYHRLTTTGDSEIRTTEWQTNISGVTGSTDNLLTPSGSGFEYYGPAVAAKSDGSYTVAYKSEHTPSSTYRVETVNADAVGNPGFAQSAITLSNSSNQVNIATFDDGYVVVSSHGSIGSRSIAMRHLDANGTPTGFISFAGNTLGNGDEEVAPDVLGLAGGGYVVTWWNLDDNEVYYQTFDSNGASLHSEAIATSGGTSLTPREPHLVALADGGFVITYGTGTGSAGTATVSGQHFSSSGTALGSEFVAQNFGTPSHPSGIGLADGRFMLGWNTAIGSGSNIETEIFDTRDDPNLPVDYRGKGWQIGTIGDDALDDGARVMYGWDGDDLLVVTSITSKAHGGRGDDTFGFLQMPTGSIFDGGLGVDTVSFNFGGVDIDLALERFIFGAVTKAITGFENAFGSEGEDIIVGTNGANVLSGGVGDDRITGGFGDDMLDGGIDYDDTVVYDYQTGSTFTTTGTINLNAGFTHFENVAGRFDEDVISGFESVVGSDYDDLITGTAGDNKLDGGLGDDTVDYSYRQPPPVFTFPEFGTINLQAGTAMFANLLPFQPPLESDVLIGIENVIGSGWNDFISGTDGDNVLEGGGGDDTLIGRFGNDVLNGGAEYDTADYGFLSALQGPLTIPGPYSGLINLQTGAVTYKANGDVLKTDQLISIENFSGSFIRENVTGSSADNTISTGAGVDILVGGFGDDVLDGGADLDTVSYEYRQPSAIVINPVFGDINLDTGITTFKQGLINPVVLETDTLSNIESVLGSGWRDVITGNAQGNALNGADGNDQISGLGGGDVLSGGSGNDDISGGTGDDILSGGADNDVLKGGSGDDTLSGGTDIDTADYSDATSDTTVILFTRNGVAQSTLSSGRDTLIDIENITGSAFNDRLTGDTASNTIRGGDGLDTLDGVSGGDFLFGEGGNDGFRARGGTDTFDGGADIDFVNYGNSTGVNAFLDGSGTNGRAAVGDTFVGIENLVGSSTGDDLLYGDAGANRLTGLGGADTLRGRAGIDQLEGGDGGDTLIGDEGADVYVTGIGSDTVVFNLAPDAANRDRITDFTSGQDTLQIDASVFGGGLVAGGAVQLVANTNPSAAAAGATFLYDTDNGTLRFDADGDAAGAADLFALLQNVPTLLASDFDVVA